MYSSLEEEVLYLKEELEEVLNIAPLKEGA